MSAGRFRVLMRVSNPLFQIEHKTAEPYEKNRRSFQGRLFGWKLPLGWSRGLPPL